MLPALLLVVGVYLCVGCIPIPNSQQFLVNGNAKPTWSIGKKADKPVRVGYTNINTAIDFLSTLVSGTVRTSDFLNSPRSLSAEFIKSKWLVSADRRHYALQYSRRSGYVVWPLCFMAWGTQEPEYIVLDVDPTDRVMDYHTVSNTTFHDNWQRMRFEPAFPELIAWLEEERQAAYRRAMPATAPSTRPSAAPEFRR